MAVTEAAREVKGKGVVSADQEAEAAGVAVAAAAAAEACRLDATTAVADRVT